MIELAVALVIIAILLGSILIPLNTQVESRNYDETQRILERAREALLGFAAATGRFPCPASATSNGAEHFGLGGSASNGICHATVTGTNVYAGFLPAATLGITPVDGQGYAVDAWGLSPFNRVRYAVSNATVANPSLVPPLAAPGNVFRPFTTLPTGTTGMRAAGMVNIAGATLLNVCASGTGVVAGSNCGTAVTLTSNAIIVLWSVGPNSATTGGASTDEAENPNPAGGSMDRVFVSKTRSAGTAGEFDDSVTWIGPATVFNRLIQAGQLP
jgi:type II secretory pathway pseudopilin PulG